MPTNDQETPRLAEIAGRLVGTGLGALQNRGELFSVEWQEEKARLIETLIWGVVCAFFAMLGVGMLTAFIIFLFPENLRIYALAGFALLYLAGAIIAWSSIKGLFKHEPFGESIAQLRKDAACLESSR
jgi:uncharacterized membrane protein YqjE